MDDTQGTRFTHLAEAVIVVEDNGYRTPSDLIKIKTQHYRQSHDWGDIDSSYIIRSHKMAKAISAQLKISPNPLNRLYKINGIRHYRRESTWFNFKVLRKIINDRYTFELRDITVDQGDTLYHVAFAANPIPPAPQYVSGRNYLIINTNDLAIVEMQFTLGLDNAPLENQNHVRFRKHDDKYYPTYLRNISRPHINTNMDDDEYDIRIFWFDDVKPEGFQRLKSPEANDPDDPRSHQRNFAGQSFWDSTFFIQKHPLDKNVKEDLQRHASLELQFMKNGVE